MACRLARSDRVLPGVAVPGNPGRCDVAVPGVRIDRTGGVWPADQPAVGPDRDDEEGRLAVVRVHDHDSLRAARKRPVPVSDLHTMRGTGSPGVRPDLAAQNAGTATSGRPFSSASFIASTMVMR
jgi:hypothetical protein